MVTDAAAARSGALELDPTLAIEAAFRSDYANLVALARLLLDNGSDAEETVQEAFVRTFARRRHLRTAAADPVPYLRRSVVNLSRGTLRRRRTQRRSTLEPPEHAASAADEVLRHQSQAEIRGALRRLPTRQRECVVLRYLLDSSTEQTAALLGISPGSVKTHLHRGLIALEVTLEDWR